MSIKENVVDLTMETSFECDICFEECREADRHTFRHLCARELCNKCVETYISGKIKENTVAIVCPAHSCRAPLDNGEIITALPSVELKQKFHEVLMYHQNVAQGRNIHCPTPNCTFLTAAVAGEPRVSCPDCKKDFCTSCKDPWHEGITCEEWQVKSECAKSLKEAMKEIKTKKCPRCRVRVSKDEMCDHVVCHECKFEFCFKCLADWTSSHPMDVHPQDVIERLRQQENDLPMGVIPIPFQLLQGLSLPRPGGSLVIHIIGAAGAVERSIQEARAVMNQLFAPAGLQIPTWEGFGEPDSPPSPPGPKRFRRL